MFFLLPAELLRHCSHLLLKLRLLRLQCSYLFSSHGIHHRLCLTYDALLFKLALGLLPGQLLRNELCLPACVLSAMLFLL
jgi:hypothetical protein